LPWAAATFDSAVVTLVFCSVSNPVRGLQEIKRVLKPEGTLFLFEHVRSQNVMTGRVQDALVPATTRLFGNCHFNRQTERAVQEAGFQVTQVQHIGGRWRPDAPSYTPGTGVLLRDYSERWTAGTHLSDSQTDSNAEPSESDLRSRWPAWRSTSKIVATARARPERCR